MTDKPERVTEIVEQLRKRNRDEASRRNSAYDHFGMDNTPESVDPAAHAAADLLEALTTRSVSEDAGQGHTSPTPWEVREYGYEKIALLDANGAEVGFVHRRRDAEAIVAALNAAIQTTDGECQRLRSALEVAVAALGRVNVRCFDKPESPLKPLGDIGREALSSIAALLGDEAYDAISIAALKE